ncbi:MAG: serine/threonine-protein kinase [Phycisphaerales bacterium]
MTNRPDRARAALVERLFFDAADLKGAARARFLDEHCKDDPDLRREVEALLSMDERHQTAAGTQGVLGHTPVSARDLPKAISSGATETLPMWVGPYKAVRRLGEGGFGLVYLAEQSEPIRRQVALKLIRPGMGSPQVVERFMAERQALALMDHPGVAKVFDAGATDDGRPYFAMEYVEGPSITTFARDLNLDDRIALLVKVCDAVHHAHQKGVIHRDLKPTNILVELEDGVARPKVIDFGIAKALAEPLTGQTLNTLSGQLVGTPEYMSPEQAGSASDVDIRGDVYSLGVVLYELLTGMLPFDSARLRSTALADIQRIIREEEPPRPSDRLQKAADQQASGATTTGLERLGLEPRDAARRIRGELDWIVGRAMEKDRERRYASAHDLAADLRRYLAGEPVLAGPPSTAYRLSKWARRHTPLLVTGAAVSIAVIAGLIGTSWGWSKALAESSRARDAEQQARLNEEAARASERVAQSERQRARLAEQQAIAEADRARDAEELAHAEAERARVEAVSAKRVADFLEEMLRGVGPVVAQGADTTLLCAILNETAEKVGDQLAAEPLAEARLRYAIGSAYHGIQRLDDAIEQLQRAASLYESLPDAPLRERRMTLHNLATTYHAADRAGDAEPIFRQVLALELENPELADSAAQTLSNLALIAYDNNDFDAADRQARQGMDLYRQAGTDQSDDACLLRNTMAMIANEQGEADRALTLYEESLEISERLRGPDHPTTLTTRANVASQYGSMQRYEDAVRVLAECVDDMRRVYGPEHSETITTLSNYGTNLLLIGRVDEVGPIYEEAERLATSHLGDDHFITQYTRNNLARLDMETGEFARAAERYAGVTAFFESRYGPADPDVRRFRNRLAEALRRSGQNEAWRDAGLAGAAGAESAGVVDSTYAIALRHAAWASVELQDADGAAAVLDRLDNAAEAMGGTSGRDMRAWAADLRGRERWLRGEREEAAALLEASYGLWVEGYGERDTDATRVAGALARLLDEMGRADDAAEWRARANPEEPGGEH